MPQIAQQDYKILAPTPGRGALNDMAVLGELKKSLLNGTIFDCLIKDVTLVENYYGRVLGAYPNSGVSIYDPGESEVRYFELPYTVTQYQGLAAIQAEADRIDGVSLDSPGLVARNGLLEESVSGYPIGTPGGYQYKVTLVDGKIVTIEVSTSTVEGDFIAISIEDAQKLIGLPCTAA